MRVLLRPPQFGGPKHACDHDNRPRHCKVSFSGPVARITDGDFSIAVCTSSRRLGSEWLLQTAGGFALCINLLNSDSAMLDVAVPLSLLAQRNYLTQACSTLSVMNIGGRQWYRRSPNNSRLAHLCGRGRRAANRSRCGGLIAAWQAQSIANLLRHPGETVD